MAEKYIRLVWDMFESSMIVVRCAVRVNNHFKLEIVLHQELNQSPLVMVMDRQTD